MTYPAQPFPSLPASARDPSPKRSAGGCRAEGRRPFGADGGREVDVHALRPDDDGDGAGAGRRHELAAVELRSTELHLFYVCGQNGVAGLTAGDVPKPTPNPNGAALHGVGSIWTVGNGFHNPGYLAAVDVTTGKVTWQDHFSDSCYSGSAVTGGNLVFVGRNGGELEAYNADDGQHCCGTSKPAPARTTSRRSFATTARSISRSLPEVTRFAGTPHGDNLWLFGLDGTLGPAPAPRAGAALQHAGEGTPVPLAPANAANGATVFAANCTICHGARGTGGNGGPDLTALPNAKDMTKVVRQVTNGGGGMPAFQATLTPQQIVDVSAYVVQTLNRRPL